MLLKYILPTRFEYFFYIWGLKVAVAAGAEGRGEERMWCILSRSLLRSFTMELPRSSLFLVISFVLSAVGQ
jgi:hypothetical protein